MPGEQPSWSTSREALSIVFAPSNLKKTIRIALIVGAIGSRPS